MAVAKKRKGVTRKSGSSKAKAEKILAKAKTAAEVEALTSYKATTLVGH